MSLPVGIPGMGDECENRSKRTSEAPEEQKEQRNRETGRSGFMSGGSLSQRLHLLTSYFKQELIFPNHL